MFFDGVEETALERFLTLELWLLWQFYGRNLASNFRHLFGFDIKLSECHALLFEERLRTTAERAPTRGVDENLRLHVVSPIVEG